MKILNSNRGYGLILVLLIITLIGIMTPLIMTNIMNNSLQFKKSENKIQLTNLAYMGEVYVNRVVQNGAKNAVEKVETWIKDPNTNNPNKSSIIFRYKEELIGYINNYIPSNELIVDMKENSDQFKIVITSLNNINDTIIVNYTITSSRDYKYVQTYSINGSQIINLEI